MKLTNLLLSAFLLLVSISVQAYVKSGEYYIVNDYFSKALADDGKGGAYLTTITDADDDYHVFEAVNASGDYVMLRNKATGKYLTASTSDTWSMGLSSAGSGDQYYWRFNQQFSTTLVSKKSSSKRVGCDYSTEDKVPVYYDKSAGGLNWFSFIPANGEGYESSLKATKTEAFTNEYGVKEQDAYCVTEATTVTGLDYHIISSTPIDGGTVELSGDKAWLVFENVKPSAVISTYLKYVTINGVRASNGSNCRVEIWLNGAVVIPGKSTELPFVATTDDGTFTVGITNKTTLGSNNNRARSFTLKRGYMVTVATGTSGSDYSRVYVADHSDLTVTLPTALDRRISSVHVRKWHYVSKRGYAKTGTNLGEANNVNASWYWNWDASTSSSVDIEYIPIKQHLYWPSDANMDKETSTAMMLFNEPEHSEQHTSSQCSCGGTIDPWKAYQNTTKFNANGMRIGSPSATDLPWIKEYLGHCDDMKQRCDFSCTHGYWSTEWASNLSTLKSYGRPIWITEWEYGASWTTSYTPSSVDEYAQKVLSVLDMLEYNDYVERYSYYSTDTGGKNGWMRALYWDSNPSKGTNPAGTVYKKVKTHFGYNAKIQPVPSWWAPSYDAPSIKNVSLANGKYTIKLENTYGDATKELLVQIKTEGGDWQTVSNFDRPDYDRTSFTLTVPAEDYPDKFWVRAVLSSIYESSTRESFEFFYDPLSYVDISELQNLTFDEGTFTDKNVLTYAKDITNAATQTSGMQTVDGWYFVNKNGDARSAAQYHYGDSYVLGGTGYVAPSTNSEGTKEGGAFGVVSVWTAHTQYAQNVCIPKGKYTITIPIYNAGGTGEIDKNLIGFVEGNGTEHLLTATTYPVGKWTTETIELNLRSNTNGYLSLGYLAPNVGSSSMPHLFIDYVKITCLDGPALSIQQTATSPTPIIYYTPSGIPSATPTRGINLVRMSDGTVRKVMKK